ncbi:MAG TPA: RDD family protein [Sulfurovum sp.]|nr:RDD family protein [Sulfurovum sp.]
MHEPASLSIASTQKRIASFVIDDIVISVFIFIIFYNQFSEVFSNITVVDQAAIESINAFIAQNIVVIFAVKIIYHTVLVWQNGMTLGKYLMKVKVVEMETGRVPGLAKSFLRASIRIPSEVLFYLGFLMAFFVPLRQTLHDKLSHCVVIDG